MNITNILKNTEVDSIVPYNLQVEKCVFFDFSEKNKELQRIDVTDAEDFTRYISEIMDKNNVQVGIGKYNEDRIIYRKSTLFQDGVIRSIHLGIDIFTKAEVPVFSPLDGKIHSYAYNNNYGDYGPTIILEHKVSGKVFYTLYGHLTLDSIEDIKQGYKITAGREFAKIGNYPVNGNWPPHLHFQIVTDMMGREGDFPGVANASEREKFLELCPDPNLILRLK